uniref:RUN domain-containing protein n=1 Tax=Setaria digitata TaxID=48799 RepID=A0A915PVS1_9BILA
MVEQNEVKAKLMTELANVLKQAASEYPSGDALSKESTQILCNTIEALFIHGLRTTFFQKKSRVSRYPEPNFWPFVSKYTHKAVLDQIAASSQIKTEIGKSRAWIRILLNENTIENYLNLLSSNLVTLSKFYEKWAFLRDTERMIVLSGYIKGLTRLTVEAPVNSFLLNAWTPTPLILSGLIAGEPARLKQLIKCHRRGSLSILEDTELAENALESLCELTEMSTSSGGGDSDVGDVDSASVYSHPSMLEGENVYLPALNAADNTVLSNPVPEDSILNYDPHQIRVTRCTHRRVRRSSKTSSLCSSASSKNELVLAIANESHDAAEVGKELENLGNSYDDKQLISSSTCKVNNENSKNKEQLTPAHKEEMVNMKKNKSFGSDIELSSSKELANRQINSKDVVDGTKSNHSLDELSYNLVYSLCPAVSVEIEQSFAEVKDTTEKAPMNPSNMELGRSTSIEDHLYLSKHCNKGNSLLGKGWITHHLWEAGPFTDQASTNSLSTNADFSRNFDVEIRNVLDGASDEVMNQKDSNHGSLGDEIPLFGKTEDLPHITNVNTLSALYIEGTVRSEKAEPEADSNGSTPELSYDKILINILTVIPHEKGLDSQDFRCLSCRKSIGPTFASYRKCGFDEKYYCDGCFNKDDESVIPSRLIRNWDGHPRRVCKNNMTFIENIRDKAVLRIDQINPQLYEHSHALSAVKFLREKLSLSAMYLESCRKSVAEDLQSRIWPKDYLYKDIHLYSFADLLTVLSGYMENHLNNLLNFTTEHIGRCLLCSQKGFICEICSSTEVIYPFQLEGTSRCQNCFSVYHKNCMEQQRCPKCTRRERYSQQQPNIGSQHLLLDLD